jgi:uncharacterized protein YjbJ (UPF0337 family)
MKPGTFGGSASLIHIDVEIPMTDERIQGAFRSIGGRVEEGFGRATGDTKMEAEGLMNQAAGAVQDAYGKTIDVASEGAKTVKDAAVSSHDFLKKFMEDNPHTTTAIALGIGLLIGYAAHRPPARRAWWD